MFTDPQETPYKVVDVAASDAPGVERAVIGYPAASNPAIATRVRTTVFRLIGEDFSRRQAALETKPCC